MESIGVVALVVVTVAIGLAAAGGLVHLWWHQPVHDAAHAVADESDDDDERTRIL